MPASSTYCTILSSNYLPKALTLAESLRRHEAGAELVVLLIDIADPADLPHLDGVRLLSTAALPLSADEVRRTAAIYHLVEFATSVKPLLLRTLLEESERVIYLDPDTYLLTPLVELADELDASEGGILLTPHFLHPQGEDTTFSDGHTLAFGVFNLGFCAVDRRAGAFLDWWWGHLEYECLNDPVVGLFTDQKWVDLGSVLFAARTLRHSGYNVGIGNIGERPLGRDADGLVNTATGERIRLFHFHAFDPSTPRLLSHRFDEERSPELVDDHPLTALCGEYAERVLAYADSLPTTPSYPYDRDTRGNEILRRHRRAYRLQARAGATLPSPFVVADAEAYAAWRRSSRSVVRKEYVGDIAKSVRWVFGDEYLRAKRRFPALSKASRRFMQGDGMWG